jgi:hypothetical protein
MLTGFRPVLVDLSAQERDAIAQLLDSVDAVLDVDILVL